MYIDLSLYFKLTKQNKNFKLYRFISNELEMVRSLDTVQRNALDRVEWREMGRSIQTFCAFGHEKGL